MRASGTFALFLLLTLGGCASVDFDYPRQASSAVSPQLRGEFADIVSERLAAHPDESGFYLLDDGIEALSARLVLAKRAERSIDIQYYLIKKDRIGYALIGSLLQAADRGVRIRLLVDDIFTGGADPGLTALHSHPNIEIRLFNPFAYRSARFMNAFQFSRLNRRMHNKVFIVDNQVAITGGRNIAKEYFAARDDTNFGDLDALMIGQVVTESSTMFDLYWNHRKALPVEAVAKMPVDPEAAMAALNERIDKAVADLRATPYIEALQTTIEEFIETEIDVLTWAPYQLVYDSPDKAMRSRKDEAASILPALRGAVMSAQSELIVASPYFVPTASAIDNIRVLEQRGVDVVIITNSLAANNHAIVHSGYAPKRRAVLETGARLFETKPDAQYRGTERAGLDAQEGTLHTKAFIVDEKVFYLGSFNWDPRSAFINTEMGVIIYSPELSEFVARRSHSRLSDSAYEVVLDARGRLRWRDQRDGELKVWTYEPETSWWKRFWVGFARILPLDSQL